VSGISAGVRAMPPIHRAGQAGLESCRSLTCWPANWLRTCSRLKRPPPERVPGSPRDDADLPDYEWTAHLGRVHQDPNNSQKRSAALTKLSTLLRFMLRMAEYELAMKPAWDLEIALGEPSYE